MIECIHLLGNIGQFDSVTAGAHLTLKKLTLIYAENGRGKTTLAAVLRSLNSDNLVPIVERQRLAANHPPHVVLTISGGVSAVFQNGSWSRSLPDIAIFDDLFVADNVCSGLNVGAGHRQNLHELILGARGVSLNKTLQDYVTRVEDHNSTLRKKGEAIPAAARSILTVDEFCALPERADIDQVIRETERNLAAARAADAVRQEPAFNALALSAFDAAAITALLQRDLPELEAEAATRVQAHLTSLGAGGEAWIGDGVRRIGSASAGHEREMCPFCAQELSSSPVITHYRAYFSAAYRDLKQAIANELASMNAAHGGEIVAAFERAVRVAIQRRQFWAEFTDVPEIVLDTAAIARVWKAALEPLVAALRAKQAEPLERLTLPTEAVAAVEAYHERRDAVAVLSGNLQAVNAQIAVVKERTAVVAPAALATDLARLSAIKVRHSPEIAPLCADYLHEKAAKLATERLREQARAALGRYRQEVFPAYETAINIYLPRLNAGFGLSRVNPVNNRGGSSCTYDVLINDVSVPITTDVVGPCFRNTLSAGDRNTLALAFFFASLDQDPQRNQKIVVIDDPITSLDEHRSLATVQEIRRLVSKVEQMIVLSHSKRFLCALWEGTGTDIRTAIKIARDGTGSTLTIWDVSQDCITEHDWRHDLVRKYIQASNAVDERTVAAALRHILESFMRVAYPEQFPPGQLLGPFLGICRHKQGTPGQILSENDINELRNLLDYANRFHHDSNSAWETATINDGELRHYCERTLNFTRRS